MSLRGNLLVSRAGALAYVLGLLLLVVAAAMLLPIACSLFYGEDDLEALIIASAITASAGLPLWWRFRGDLALEPRHALFLATIGWIVISSFSALPFVIHGSIPSFTDAFFEMMSGYTTTGATILEDIETLPHGLLLWRSQTHLIGGMGFVTLAVTILPHGMGGLRLFRAESSPGQVITRERFTARNRDAIRFLWGIYLALNVAMIVLLMLGGMSLFDAMCHAFGSVSTSGYSTYNASVGYFDSAYVDWIVTLFMFLGGMTFMLFYYLWKRDFRAFAINTEFWWYCGSVFAFCAFTTFVLWSAGTYDFFDSLRFGSFQIVSILTTTGFVTADYEQWPHAAQMAIFVVCFIGACAGSTTSGVKIVHYVIIMKFMSATVRKLFFQPLAVVSVRLNRQKVDDAIVHLALVYFIVNIFLVLLGGLFMSVSDDMDPLSAVTSVTATLMNIGPGFGDVGPSHNFAFISDVGKWFLSINMLVGRLEMFTALVLLYPSFWRG